MKTSLRTILITAIVLMIAISATLAISYSVELYNSMMVQIAGNAAPSLHAVWTTVTANLSSAESYLKNVVYDSTQMGYLGSQEDPSAVYEADDRLRDAYVSLLSADGTITGILIYDRRTELFHTVYGHLSGSSGTERIAQKTQIREALLPKLQEDSLDLWDWNYLQIGTSTMMYRAIYWAGCYTIALVDLDNLVSYYTDLYDLPGQLILVHDERCLTDTGGYDLDLEDAQPISDNAWLIRESNTLVVCEPGERMDFYSAIPLDTLISQVSSLQWIILIAAFLCVVGLCAVFIYLRRQFVLPMGSLMNSMERIRAGELEVHSDQQFNTTEFRALNETFSSMITSLRNARIQTYEKDLENQRILFNSLRLQIRPHFYLNCLKCVYASASLGDTETVCRQILYLSTHLRYCFSDLGETVPLHQELEMCRNYVNMIALNQRQPIHLRVDVETALADFAIPPMTLLTAVENAAKYYRQSSIIDATQLCITIQGRILSMEDGRLVNLTVQDNGPGFSSEALRLIQNPTTDHVGISNILQQLRLYFGDDCEVTFTNQGGALINYFIPIKENRHEFADR